jgi:hypothetical protein
MRRHHTADGAEEDHLSPVLVQMWQPWASSPGADVAALGEPSPGADVERDEPGPFADVSQMLQRRARSQCRFGSGKPGPGEMWTG